MNTIDGTPTFLSIGIHHGYHQNDCIIANTNYQTGGSIGSGGGSSAGSGGSIGGIGGHYHHHNCIQFRPQRLSRHELKQLDEKELIFELVRYRRSVFNLIFSSFQKNNLQTSSKCDTKFD